MNLSPPANASHDIKICNRLLRGEISAVQTYNQVIEKFPREPETPEIAHIRDKHQRSADQLKVRIRSLGGTPEAGSGAWGAFAKSIQGAANLFGENSALCTLRQGEELGKGDYEKTLRDDRVKMPLKVLIRTELLPRVLSQIDSLSRLLKNNR